MFGILAYQNQLQQQQQRNQTRYTGSQGQPINELTGRNVSADYLNMLSLQAAQQGREYSPLPYAPASTPGPQPGAPGAPRGTAGIQGMTGSPSGPAQTAGGASVYDHLFNIESGNRNIPSQVDPGDINQVSQGYGQINTPTWEQFAPKAGVDIKKIPRAMLADRDTQIRVTSLIPFKRYGARTQQMMQQLYGPIEPNETIGELEARVNRTNVATATNPNLTARNEAPGYQEGGLVGDTESFLRNLWSGDTSAPTTGPAVPATPSAPVTPPAPPPSPAYSQGFPGRPGAAGGPSGPVSQPQLDAMTLAQPQYHIPSPGSTPPEGQQTTVNPPIAGGYAPSTPGAQVATQAAKKTGLANIDMKKLMTYQMLSALLPKGTSFQKIDYDPVRVLRESATIPVRGIGGTLGQVSYQPFAQLPTGASQGAYNPLSLQGAGAGYMGQGRIRGEP